MSRIRFFSVLMLTLSACSHASFSPRIEYFGEYKNSRRLEKQAAAMPIADAESIVVSMGQLPRGVELKDGAISVAPDADVELVAKISAQMNFPGMLGGNEWFYDYDESQAWRKGFCYWQVPLSWITVGMWAYLSPLSHPCKVYEGSSISAVDGRKERMIDMMKRATKVVGGDFLVVTDTTQLSTTNAKTGQPIGVTEMANGSGYAFRRKNSSTAPQTPGDIHSL